MNFCKAMILVISAGVFALGAVQSYAQIQDNCDRACLDGYMEQYLDALVANDHGRLPLSPDVRFTENTIELNLGQGLWSRAESLGRQIILVADPHSQQAGFLGVVLENGEPRMLAARLLIKNGEIREIETIVARTGMTTIPLPEGLETRVARPAFAETLRPRERSTRSAMVLAANQYFEGIEQNSGDVVPFDEQCERFENGVQTTGNSQFGPPGSPVSLGCRDQFNAGGMFWTLPERRFWMVDVERGLVFGAFVFRSELPESPPPAAAPGEPALIGPMFAHNAIAELFKIKNGRLHEIEAVLGPMLPYGQTTGW